MAQSQVTGSRSERITVKTFSGGLNNVSDITTIDDEELHRLINFELDANGSLVSRPPITQLALPPVTDEPIDILGFYTDPNEVSYAVVACDGDTYLYNLDTNTYSSAIATFAATGAAQWGGNLYLCSDTQSGGYWNGTTFTSLASGPNAMPRGEQIVLYKARFFMISREPGHERGRIHFSNITTLGPSPTSINEWEPDNYFDVSKGDGQFITKIISAANELFIFRTKSTYYFKYQSAPIDGALDLLDNTVGADNKYSVGEYEFSYLVLNNGRLYRFVSYQFYPLNDISRLGFAQTKTNSVLSIKSALTVFGRRAVVWFGGGTYALDLETGAWSEWLSPGTEFAWGLLKPRKQDALTPDTVIGITGVNTTNRQKMYQLVDAYLAGNVEEIECVAETKAFDFDIPDLWKRLFYWSADVYTARDVDGTVSPIQFTSLIISWDDLEAFTFDQLELGTWDFPIVKNPDVQTHVVYPALLPYRVNVTFQKDMRFRRASFEVKLSTDGTTATGPVRIIALVIHAVLKRGISDIIQ
jgi:hypothetical protein